MIWAFMGWLLFYVQHISFIYLKHVKYTYKYISVIYLPFYAYT